MKEKIKQLEEQIKQEIKNTVDMERLSKENLRLYNEEYRINKEYKKFIEYVEEVCKCRMTFENPNETTKICLNFIDTTFDDFILRIKDLKTIIGVEQ